jgi:hypothetical protein
VLDKPNSTFYTKLRAQSDFMKNLLKNYAQSKSLMLHPLYQPKRVKAWHFFSSIVQIRCRLVQSRWIFFICSYNFVSLLKTKERSYFFVLGFYMQLKGAVYYIFNIILI